MKTLLHLLLSLLSLAPLQELKAAETICSLGEALDSKHIHAPQSTKRFDAKKLTSSPSLEPLSSEQQGYYNKALAQLASIKKRARTVELYAEPYRMASKAYLKSPRSKQKSELIEQSFAKWRRITLCPKQSATLLAAAKSTKLLRSGTPNMRTQPVYSSTLAFRDAQGKLLGTIDPHLIFPRTPKYRDFFFYYQLNENKSKELHRIIFKSFDASGLFKTKFLK